MTFSIPIKQITESASEYVKSQIPKYDERFFFVQDLPSDRAVSGCDGDDRL